MKKKDRIELGYFLMLLIIAVMFFGTIIVHQHVNTRPPSYYKTTNTVCNER